MDEQLLRDSIHAITQWQEYGIEQRGKSQAGYFSNGGWAYETLEKLRSELVAYLNGNSSSEVAELKRKLAEVEGERDALLECGEKLNLLYDLNSIFYRALENIANQGHAFDGSTNADLAKRTLKLYEDRAKHEKAQ